MSVIRVFILLLFIVVGARAYKILAVFPHEGKSHLVIYSRIVRKLIELGHEVTVISHYSFDIKNETYSEILLNDPNGVGEDLFAFDDPYITGTSKDYMWQNAYILLDEGLYSCRYMLSNENVQHIIGSNEKFDLIFAEFFNSECIRGFQFKFDVPVVGISSTTLMPWHNRRFANPDNPSYIPNNHLSYNNQMSFSERLWNLLGNLYFEFYYMIYLEDNKALIEKYFHTEITSMNSLINKNSLMLVNSHFSFTSSRPLVPGVVEIGGVHIHAPHKLPKNIEKFINESTDGVIYFSMGSMIKGHTFPEEKREEFLRAFARLPQRVLWKWENETMPGKPDNVMIQKWMPQFDILSHPNVKAFISHGGLLGTTEAIHCGVPMMVMPQFGDQHTNARAIEANGGGVILYLREATEEKVYQGLKTILDPAFKKKTEELSERFRDRPMSPMDTAIYWIEYVARHKGAPHLRTAAVDMPIYQYLLLDVFAFLFVIFVLFSYISYKFTFLIFRSIIPPKKIKKS